MVTVGLGPLLAQVEESYCDEEEGGDLEEEGCFEEIGIDGGFHASIPGSKNGG